jgi:type IV pilus assembly protein PilF
MDMIAATRLLAVLAVFALAAGCVSSETRPESEISDKEAAEYNMQLGVSYLRQGDLTTAQAKLEKALEQDPSLHSAHAALGVVFERLGDEAGAEKHYRRAVSLAPDDPDVLNSLAVFLCRERQDPAEALQLFDRALAVPLSQTRYNRAMVYTNAGTCAKRVELPRAEQYLRAALNSDPNFKDALLQMADVAFNRGNHLQARAFVERYLAAGTASPGALWLGFQVETALGQGQAARNYAQRLTTEFPESVETRLLLERERDAG